MQCLFTQAQLSAVKARSRSKFKSQSKLEEARGLEGRPVDLITGNCPEKWISD